MQGERVEQAVLTERGLVGDRAYGLIDVATGMVVSAKNPRKWPNLLDHRATFRDDDKVVRITLPSSTTVDSDTPDIHQVLSAALGRAVELRAVAPVTPTLQQLWPDTPGEPITTEPMPEGTFFDLGTLHLLTTATLARFRALAPDSDFDERRFRPNIVLNTAEDIHESRLIGRTLLLGERVRVQLTAPTLRCVMTTLSQPELPADANTLRTIVRNAEGIVGVYGTATEAGPLRIGDLVWVE